MVLVEMVLAEKIQMGGAILYTAEVYPMKVKKKITTPTL
jgi:hypothetical protein